MRRWCSCGGGDCDQRRRRQLDQGRGRL
jgi:hypothetical protein